MIIILWRILGFFWGGLQTDALIVQGIQVPSGVVGKTIALNFEGFKVKSLKRNANASKREGKEKPSETR